jgi:hypothetical protein
MDGIAVKALCARCCFDFAADFFFFGTAIFLSFY